jgi:hypothetical protein
MNNILTYFTIVKEGLVAFGFSVPSGMTSLSLLD